MTERLLLYALVAVLLFLIAAQRALSFLSAPASAIEAGRRLEASLALVLAGDPPVAAARRVSDLLRLCHWPRSVKCYVNDGSGLAPDGLSMWPLDLLAKSSCYLALLLPWDVDLGEGWDLRVYQSLEGCAARGLYSCFVPGCSRARQCRQTPRACAPPQVVFPARGAALAIPDFRFALGPPGVIEKLALTWFPSFFAGLLAYPVPTLQLPLPKEGPFLAADPLPGVACDDHVPLSSRDATTLVALGALEGAPGLDPLIWELLFEEPAPYVRLPSDRQVLRR
jgi:hypothetical protein